MTMLEVEMAEKGTFSYASVSESDMEVLFEQFIFKYSRKVRWEKIEIELSWDTWKHHSHLTELNLT